MANSNIRRLKRVTDVRVENSSKLTSSRYTGVESGLNLVEKSDRSFEKKGYPIPFESVIKLRVRFFIYNGTHHH